MLHRALQGVSLFNRGKKTRVAISVSTVMGDMIVAMTGIHVGKGRITAVVRAQDILVCERAVSH